MTPECAYIIFVGMTLAGFFIWMGLSEVASAIKSIRR